MGVLDDAIREHLDLKRQHGASDEELDRQENEALGPARQAAEPQEVADSPAAEGEPAEADLAAQEAHPEAPAGPADLAELAEEQPAPAELAEEPPPPAEEPPPPAEEPPPPADLESEPTAAQLESLPAADDEPASSQPFDFDEEEPGVAPPMPGPHAVAQGPAPVESEPADPVEADPIEVEAADREPVEDEPLAVEDEPLAVEPGEEAKGDGDDVLEETPDFLQETPEHDRLWFEQKPPRDFDFD